MAFCPNCGTPNTDQAAKCVSCAFELAPAQKAKFKGTIMMSGVQVPQGPQAPAAPAAPSPAPAAPPAGAPAPAASPQGSSRNMAFEKTMMGPMAGASPISAPPADARDDLARAATVEGPAPQFTPPPAATGGAAASSAASAPAAAAGAGYAGTGYGSTTGNFGGGGDDGAPPMLPKPNTGKVLAIGCAVVLVMTCLIVGVMYFMARKQISAILGSAEQADDTAVAWRGTLSQALTQVSALCASNCDSAATYFHPNVQATLLGQAQQLTPARLQRLVDPTQSEAAMLNTTDDGSLATNLGLDPQLCVLISSGNAKAIGCSVPNPNGAADMRIVHLSGLDTL